MEKRTTLFQVTVVGAGPAGLVSAEILARNGIDVKVIDRDINPGEKKPCGGMLRIASADLLGIPWRLASRKIKGMRVILPNHEVCEVDYGRVISLNIDRRVLGQYLIDRVRKAGGCVDTGTNVVDLTENFGVNRSKQYELRCKTIGGEKSRLRTDLLLATDGTNSLVAKKTGVHDPFKPDQIGQCVQYQIEINNNVIEKRIGDRNEVYYGRDVSPFGYAWIFPKDNLVTVGVGALLSTVKTNLRKYLDYFVGRHSVARKKLEGGKIVEFETALCPLSGLISPTYDNNLVVAGDAAGHCSAISGEGMYYSMVAGKLAGEVCSQAIKVGDLSAKYLRRYEVVWRRAIGSDLRWGKWLQRIALRSGLLNGSFQKKKSSTNGLGKSVIDILAGIRPYRRSLVKAIPEFFMSKIAG
jgi:digeranylgeranylglycerophospholipid reductase